jgi:mannose-6-phosphate isomerase
MAGMDRIRRLRNPIRDYAWGSRTALAQMQGRPSPTASPEAELWMGAHPLCPSEVEADSGWVPLSEWIRRDPAALLGEQTARRFAGELPFLFKVLAAERALSIQAHPDAEQARAGFERENAAGLALEDPRRNYRDAHAKPELICAFTRFAVLCGFRPTQEIAANLEALGVPGLRGEAARLRASPGRAGLEPFFRELLTRGAEERRRVAAEVADAAQRAADGGPPWSWVTELARQHPGDLGVLAPLLLNLIELSPGEALYLPPGELHSYLHGVGVELAGNSDNVLRGGLTGKRVDVAELLSTLSFRQGSPPRLAPRALAPGEAVYDTPARDFVLSVLRPSAHEPVERGAGGSLEILLCVEGEAAVVDLTRDERTPLPGGAAALVPASVPGHRLEGEARVFAAGVPR